MSHPVTIENDAIRMQVWPQTGGKVSSIIDKVDEFELLFNYPAELPQSASYDTPYGDSWCAGWDECFPAIAAGKYVGHPYDGIAVPDHGELWGIPATTAVPTRDGIVTVWHGLRFGYRLTRKLYLDGADVAADYTLINLAPFDFKFVWSMHSLLSMAAPIEIQLGKSSKFRLSHDASGTEIQRQFNWPIDPSKDDLSKPMSLPPRRAWKAFSEEPIASPLVVQYPGRDRLVSIQYSSQGDHGGLVGYWGIWINTGGAGGYRHFGIEPTTGRFDQLDRCVEDQSAGNIAPLGRREWGVRWSLR